MSDYVTPDVNAMNDEEVRTHLTTLTKNELYQLYGNYYVRKSIVVLIEAEALRRYFQGR